MSNTNYTYEQLIEKIVRAKVVLEDTHNEHQPFCLAFELGDHAPCKCGASGTNNKILAAIIALKL